MIIDISHLSEWLKLSSEGGFIGAPPIAWFLEEPDGVVDPL